MFLTAQTTMNEFGGNVTASCLSRASAFSNKNTLNATYTAPDDCCTSLVDDVCIIYAASCQVLYWTSHPPNASVPLPSTLRSNDFVL